MSIVKNSVVTLTSFKAKSLFFDLVATSFVPQIICYLFLLSFLSGCSTTHTPAPVITIKGNIPLKDRIKNSINTSQYTVKSGETLYSIAWRANSDVRELAKINTLTSPYRIYPGQKLFLAPKKLVKTSQASNHKGSTKNQNKHSTPTTSKIIKKTIASNRKLEYGEKVDGRNVVRNSTKSTTKFSQKISRWYWPVKGKIIATFSTKAQGNKGLNISGRRGTKIKATANGKVVYAGNALRGYGNLVIIKHNEDYLSAYAHNDRILVKEQQLVKAGDMVATMGDTGAQRVMLHFEVRFRGKSVNPLKYLPKK
ncbi:MAG: peptidoglycan DD-metalloendopeptidase family protein [Colwellia sp.]